MIRIANLEAGDLLWVPGNGPITVQHVLNLGGVWKAAVTTQDGQSILLTEDDEPLVERVVSIHDVNAIVVRDLDHLIELLEGGC